MKKHYALALGLMAVVMQFGMSSVAHAKLVPMDQVKLPKGIYKESGNPKTMALVDQASTVSEAMKQIGIETSKSYQIMDKVENNFYYAIVGEGEVISTWVHQDTPSVDDVNLPVAPIVMNPYTTNTLPITSEVGSAIDTGNFSPVRTDSSSLLAKITKPKEIVKPKKQTFSANLLQDYLNKLNNYSTDYQISKNFTLQKKGDYIGAIRTTAWMGQVPYVENIQIALTPNQDGSVTARYVMTQENDRTLRSKLEGYFKQN